MLTVTLYARPDCHLCEQARADLQSLQAEVPHRLLELNIDDDPALQQAYALEIPVLEAGPYRLNAPFTRQQLLVTLNAASDRVGQLQRVDAEGYQERLQRTQTLTTADRLSYWISRHYLAVVNLALLFYVGLPFLAPVLLKVGAVAPANIIYTVYSPLCHQFGFRSWFLFGEQAYYPLKEAGIPDVVDFETATGFLGMHDSAGLARLQARAFRGDEHVGYKVALCERDVAIYLAMLLFGLLYPLSGRRLKSLHWLVWLILAFGPIGLDGFSQLISQLPFPAIADVLPYRESTPLLRTLTGFLFGFSTAWFAIPNVEEGMAESRQYFAKKTAISRASRP